MRKVWALEDIIEVAERFVLEAVPRLEEHQGDEDSTKLKKRVLNKGMDELLKQITTNKSLVPDCKQGCNWSFSRLIFLVYKSQDIEDETLTVMARLVILLYLCHVFFVVAENLLIQTEGNNKMDLQH